MKKLFTHTILCCSIVFLFSGCFIIEGFLYESDDCIRYTIYKDGYDTGGSYESCSFRTEMWSESTCGGGRQSLYDRTQRKLFEYQAEDSLGSYWSESECYTYGEEEEEFPY